MTTTPPTGSVSSDVMFEQVCATANHYSALRFASFSLFAAITAGLLAAEFSLELPQANHPAASTVPWVGVILTLIFWIVHLRISTVLSEYQACAYAQGLRQPRGHEFWAEAIPLLFSVCFLIPLCAWVALLACPLEHASR